MDPEEQELFGDYRYRNYSSVIEKALRSFESSSEWADLISSLGRLNKFFLHVDGVLSPKSSGLSWIIALLLADIGRSQCFTFCVQCSPGSAPLALHHFLEVVPVHMESLQFIIPLSIIVFPHQHVPQFV
uniref:DOP1 N-terminal domain-containing protein n=1 Tax=Monodelphis domestica TaxID=13616 RepID=A0A5F8H6C9_MONDO